MKLTLAITMLIALASLTFAQEPLNPMANDEAGIGAGVQQMQDGWNSKNGTRFAHPFATDADYVVINGTLIKGHDDIAKGHQQIFQTIFKDSTLTLSVQRIRFLRQDIAVVHVAGHIKIRRGPETQENNVIMTLVMSKEKNGWLIEAFQNTEIKASLQR